MKTQIHHKLPRSLGGSDDPSNLIELSLYEHAELHALEFINGGIHFDMRNPFWPVLQAENPELAEKVKEENSRRMSVKGKIIGKRSKEEKFGIFQPGMSSLGGRVCGKQNAESGHCAKIAHLGGLAAGPAAAAKLNSQRWKCTVTNHVSTPGPLTLYQRSRGIDLSNRIRLN
jgi:hypothetical protein